MNLFNIPFLNGKKTALAGWGLLLVGIGGLLSSLGDLFTTAGNCLTFAIDLQTCGSQLSQHWTSAVTAFAGLGILGIGHKIEKNS